MKLRELLEYLRTLFKVKRAFAEKAGSKTHINTYNEILSELDRAEEVLNEGEKAQATRPMTDEERKEAEYRIESDKLVKKINKNYGINEELH